MRIDDYISHLRDNNVDIIVADDDVKVKASKKHLTTELLEDIKKRKGDIIQFFKQSNPVKKRILPALEQASYPLSHAQGRLWVLDQISDAKGLYNVPLVNFFKELDVPSFRQAFIGLISRHEVLRTTFHLIEGEPRQVVHQIDQLNFNEIIQVREEQEVGDVDQFIYDDFFTVFDLSRSCVRLALIRKPDASYACVLTLHHIITDMWSADILARDLSLLYAHYESGQALELPALQIQYKDYAQWQLDNLANGAFDGAKRYWHHKLSGELPTLRLPLDGNRPNFRSYAGASITFEVSWENANDLASIANTQRATPFMALLAIVNMLLHKYTGQEDIIVGIPVSVRDHPDLENQVGFYGNNVVIRTSVKASDTFDALLGQVRATMLDGLEHQSYPFDLLVDELTYDRSMARNPLFDVMVSYVNAGEGATAEDEPFSDEMVALDKGVSKFDLSYAFKEKPGGGLSVEINYNRELFKKEKIVRMAHHLSNILRNVIASPAKRIGEMKYLSDSEVNEIVNNFNGTSKSFSNISIIGLIEQQVRRTPGAICLVSNQGSLTFDALNKRANQLARVLQATYGVRKGDYVGIMMGDSIQRIVSLLAILKTGAAYIPIDPDFPAERKSYILNDTLASVLITDTGISADERLAGHRLSLVVPDDMLRENADVSDENLAIVVEPTDTFAVLYTSGSTGKPKGVLVVNEGLVNRMQWLWERYGFNAQDVIYQKTPYVFDVSIGELYMPLCYGAKLLVATSATTQEIIENIEKHQVTYVHFSPTLLNNFLKSMEGDLHRFDSVRFVFASGEALLKETVVRYYNKFKAPLINLYGPTEASIEASYYETHATDETIPIGRPIANVKLYILDQNNDLLPIGLPGEIGIGGVALAKGYLNQPEMTSEKFIPDPFFDGLRIYKTGDVGQWTKDGQIEFLGRRDNQVSINGSRIELGEIESTLLEHPGVKEAAVIVDTDSFNNYYLVAFYSERNDVVRDDVESAPAVTPTLPTPASKRAQSQGEIKDYKIDYAITRLLQQAAHQYPDKTAVIFEKKELSYRDLDETSSQLAGMLKAQFKIGPGCLVGIALQRSERIIVSMLAILKTGAAYVPIDPDYPAARVNYMVSDSGIAHILVDDDAAAKTLPGLCTTISYDAFEERKQHHAAVFDLPHQSAQDLCYVCYTSGSTGVPKGVMIQHASVIDYVMTFRDYFSITYKDVVIQQSSISFDTSVEEIFPALCSGATLVILRHGGRDVNDMIRKMNEHRATLVSTTPLVIHELNASVDDIVCLPRVLISGGDELKPQYIDKLIHKVSIVNTYGPTETTVCVSFSPVVDLSKCNIIGRPIVNHSIYVLDDNLQAQPEGAIGDLYIGGAGLASGYINQESETTKRFIKCAIAYGLLYRTGDLGRWTADGTLEYCGRSDNQVKIMGHRVEPMEVDMAVLKLKHILQSLTLPRKDSDGNNHLVTYYQSEGKMTPADVRSALSSRLPHYLIPAFFVEVNDFPKNINGKIDTQALPIPEELIVNRKFNGELRDLLKMKLPTYMVPSHFRNLRKLPLTVTGKIDRKQLKELNAKYKEQVANVAPVGAIEQSIASAWEQCLNRARISVGDNFFEIGGNSLKATQILGALYTRLNINLALKDLFNNPTISELASFISKQKDDKGLLLKLNKIDSREQKKNVFFVPPVFGSSTMFIDLARALNGDFNAYGLQCKGFDFDAHPDTSVEAVAATFVSELKKVENGSTIRIVGYSMGVATAFEMTKLLEREGKSVQLIAIDRGIGEADSEEIDRADIDKTIDVELSWWLKEARSEDVWRIKNLVLHNLRILSRYRPEGKINSDIVAIEGLSKTQMRDWTKYTDGQFEHHYIQAHHYQIVSKENIPFIAKLIGNAFSGPQ